MNTAPLKAHMEHTQVTNILFSAVLVIKIMFGAGTECFKYY